MQLERVRQEAYALPWAILQKTLKDMLRRLSAAEEPRDPQAALQSRQVQAVGKVAVLSLSGIIMQRASFMLEFFGGTSTEQFAQAFDDAIANPDIRAIVIDVDSPGGSVAGTAELAQRIYDARDQKKIVAIADSLAASAAYWIGSAAAEFWATPTAEVGSIGVFAVHEDTSQADAEAGVKYTLVKAGKYKAEGNPYEPLSAEAQAYMQTRVDDYYGMFVQAVAKQRGVGVDAVRGGFGQGRVVGADDAKAQGMIDRIGTLNDVLVSLRAVPGPNARSRAELLQARQLLVESELTS